MEHKMIEKECTKCKGNGFHHGFGEHGHDPDWCTECGGSGMMIEKEMEDEKIESSNHM